MRDLAGRPVLVNDYLAHFTRSGSSMFGNIKQVAEVHDDYLVVRAFDGGRKSTIRHNFVVIPPPPKVVAGLPDIGGQ